MEAEKEIKNSGKALIKDGYNLPDHASLNEIRKLYKELIFRWHPDRCKEDPQICNEKIRKIQEAHKKKEKR